MQKLKRIYILLLSVILIFGCSFSSYADMRDLMIGTNSNALMTLDLGDDDFGVTSRSSIMTINNTIDYSNMFVVLNYRYRSNDSSAYTRNISVNSDGSFYGYGLDDSVYLWRVNFYLGAGSLPSPGNYYMSVDYSSDFSYDYRSGLDVYSSRSYENASSVSRTNTIDFEQSSGDFYVAPVCFEIGNLDNLQLILYPSSKDIVHFGGLFKVRFTKTTDTPQYSTAGSGNISQDYQDGVSSSLSDLSSSVDTMTDEISGVTEAIQSLQGAMEPHYSNVLTQLHHITEQLHAFYDQIYNNIHLKEFALWQDIKTAIENIDLEVNVNLDKLKTSIDNMSQAIQNKLQSVTDTITGGYDNSGIEQNGNALDSSINEYEEAEQNVLESVNDSLNDFEFEADMSEYKNIVQVISDFLQELYDSSGGFKLVINLSLMLSVASIVIGVYRFKEGG